MAQPITKPQDSQQNRPEPGQRDTPRSSPSGLIENEGHGMERQPAVPLGEQIRAHTNRPHKGDVGREGTNEEVFQGSKMKELK